jgi:hypothetical protein
VFKCPDCQHVLYLKITSIYKYIRVTSGLGPNFVVCSTCNTKLATHHQEWVQMSIFQKAWYLILSVLYGLILGFVVFMPAYVFRIFDLNLAGLLYIGITTFLIFLLQLYRIILSNRRMADNQDSVEIVNFWNWETNLQFYGMTAIILFALTPPLIGMVYNYLITLF